MAKIKIVDLPKDMKITKEELKKFLGGRKKKTAKKKTTKM